MERTKQMMDKLYELQTLYHHEKASQDSKMAVDFPFRKPRRLNRPTRNSNSSVGRLGMDSLPDSESENPLPDIAISEPVSVASSFEKREPPPQQEAKQHLPPPPPPACTRVGDRKVKEAEIKLIAAQLAPILDRLGRLLTDVSPHIYRIAYQEPVAQAGDTSSSLAGNAGSVSGREDAQSSASADVGREAEDFPMIDEPQPFRSMLDSQTEPQLEEKGQEAVDEDRVVLDRQVPVISTPGDVLTVSNLINRRFARAGLHNGGVSALGSLLEPNIQFHIHAILNPQQQAGSTVAEGGPSEQEKSEEVEEESKQAAAGIAVDEEEGKEGERATEEAGKEMESRGAVRLRLEAEEMEGEGGGGEVGTQLEALEKLKEEFEWKLEKVKGRGEG